MRYCAHGTRDSEADERGLARRPTLVSASVSTLASGVEQRAVVLVEGASDRHALETLARRRGMDLTNDGIAIVAMGGASNIVRFLEVLGPHGRDLAVAGLFDAAEVGDIQRGLDRAGLGQHLHPAEMESFGFYMCVEDLEDELIRHLGIDSVQQVIHAQGESASLRTFQRQPAQRGRTSEQQLRRFMGTRSGRKIRYGRLLVEALDLDHVPRPLDGVLAHISTIR
jgi:hypothetical protein